MPKSTNAHIMIPAVEAEAIMPAASLDMLITTLMNPVARDRVAAQLDARIAARTQELEPLLNVRKTLETLDINNKSNLKSDMATENRNNMIVIETHVIAIAIALENEKNGLTFSGLRTKLDEIGHPIEYKTLQSTVRRMIRRGEIKTKGPSGQFRYKLSIKC